MRQAVAKGRHLGVQFLPRSHELAGAVGHLGQAVEQVSVHVVADAHHEDLRAGRVQLLDLVEDLVRDAFTNRGRPVGEEDHDPRPAGVGLTGQGFLQRPRDVRLPVGDHVVDELARRGQYGRLQRHQLVAEAAHGGAEGDDVEAVALVEVFEAIVEGRAGLLDLLAAHRTAGIEDEDHVLLDDALGGRAGRVAQQHEEAVLFRRAAERQHAQAEVVLVGDPVEAEVVHAGPAVGPDRGGGLGQALALDGGVVRRAEYGAQRLLGVQVDVEREPFHRRPRPRRGRHGARQPVDALRVADRRAERHGHLGLALQLHVGDEDGGPAAERQELRAAGAASHCLVQGLRLLDVEIGRVGEDGRAATRRAERHAQVGAVRALGKRDQADRLNGLFGPFDDLLDLDAGGVVVDVDAGSAVAHAIPRLAGILRGGELAVVDFPGDEDRPGLSGRRQKQQRHRRQRGEAAASKNGAVRADECTSHTGISFGVRSRGGWSSITTILS